MKSRSGVLVIEDPELEREILDECERKGIDPQDVAAVTLQHPKLVTDGFRYMVHRSVPQGPRAIKLPQGAKEKKKMNNENQGTFGWAIAQLKEGQKVSRMGWNGKDMWIGFMESVTIPSDLVNGRTKKFFPEGDLKVQGYFAMFTAQGTWAPGWLASQADMLATDWGIVD